MATIDTSANLIGYFKERYADVLVNLVPETSILTKEVKFEKSKELGNLYHQPVIVQNENGFTYTNTDGGALNTPITMQTADAQIQGSMIIERNQIGYKAITASMESEAAFGHAFDTIVENMYESMGKRLEIGFLYGGTGLAAIASGVATSATVETVTITAPSWAAGIWGGLQGAAVQVFYGTGADAGAGTLVSSGADSVFTVGAVTLPTVTTVGGTIALTGTATGCTALAAAIAGQTNLNIYFNGANGVEAVGLKRILTNSGVLFNIDASAFNLWQANVIPTSGSLSQKTLQYAIGVATSRGLAEAVKVFVSPNTWSNLLNNEVALRRYDSSYSAKELESGSSSIMFHSQNPGGMEVVSHLYVKDGDCMIVPMKRLKRIGSTDVTQSIPGPDEDQLFLNMPNNAAYELRLFSDQALLLEKPATAVLVTGFVNTL
jgi:hypothetical protein